MIRSVIFLSRREVEAHQWPIDVAYWACISVTDPGSTPASLKLLDKEAILRLEFDDIEGEYSESHSRISDEQARKIVDFTDSLIEDQDEWNVVVHCEAGISRSAAIAHWLCQKTEIPPPANRVCFPNRTVIRALEKAFYYKHPLAAGCIPPADIDWWNEVMERHSSEERPLISKQKNELNLDQFAGDAGKDCQVNHKNTLSKFADPLNDGEPLGG